jgi:hypothetical protein
MYAAIEFSINGAGKALVEAVSIGRRMDALKSCGIAVIPSSARQFAIRSAIGRDWPSHVS